MNSIQFARVSRSIRFTSIVFAIVFALPSAFGTDKDLAQTKPCELFLAPPNSEVIVRFGQTLAQSNDIRPLPSASDAFSSPHERSRRGALIASLLADLLKFNHKWRFKTRYLEAAIDTFASDESSPTEWMLIVRVLESLLRDAKKNGKLTAEAVQWLDLWIEHKFKPMSWIVHNWMISTITYPVLGNIFTGIFIDPFPLLLGHAETIPYAHAAATVVALAVAAVSIYEGYFSQIWDRPQTMIPKDATWREPDFQTLRAKVALFDRANLPFLSGADLNALQNIWDISLKSDAKFGGDPSFGRNPLAAGSNNASILFARELTVIFHLLGQNKAVFELSVKRALGDYLTSHLAQQLNVQFGTSF